MPTSTMTKHFDFTNQLARAKHDFSSATFKMALCNTAPTTANAILGDLTQISGGNGYTTGGNTLSGVTLSTTSGVAKVVITDLVVTASGGSIGPFRYGDVFNDTQTSPAKPLVGWYDYGASITLADGESLTFDFDGTNGVMTIT